jgi:hypothetical protein
MIKQTQMIFNQQIKMKKKCLTEAMKTLAAAMKSSVFPPVQEPMYTLSILTSLHSLANARLSGEWGCKVRSTSVIKNST